jgi:transcriptional regulator with XRE-family HTH domain
MKISEIGKRIRFLRLQKNYTIEYMAERLSMSASGYAKIERGNSSPTLERLQAIADILECELVAIFADTLPTPIENQLLSQMEKIAERMHQLETKLYIIVKEINIVKKSREEYYTFNNQIHSK